MFNLTVIQYAAYWQSIGVSLRDAVALVGSHSGIVPTGPTNTQLDQIGWSNNLYRAQVCARVRVCMRSHAFGPLARLFQRHVFCADAPTTIEPLSAI